MEDFVSFELAKKLKEKGYPQKFMGNYDMLGPTYIDDGRFYENGCITEVARAYSAPIISQVLKWLREEKKIHIVIDIWKVDINDTIYKWGYDILNLTTTEVIGCDTQCANSYEQAALAGIEYVIDNNLI